MTFQVCVCIVSYRSAADVMRCLDGLAKSAWRDFEVVVCENGGPEAFKVLSAQLPDRLPGGQPVRALSAERNLGYAGGVNLCINNSRDAEAWWILNPDTHPYPEALAALVGRLRRGDCEAVGNTLHLPDGQVQSHGGLWRRSLARAVSIGYGAPVGEAPDPAEIESVQNYLNGASMLVSRRFIDVAGLMDESYFLYCEEVEWCLRAKARGLRLGFAPGGLVLHERGTSTGNSVDLKTRSKLVVYLDERNRMILTRDLYPALLPVAAAAALALLVLRFARGRAWRQLGYALQGWSAGLMNRRGPPSWSYGAAH
jgi:GT2 family glycosyltransferase